MTKNMKAGTKEKGQIVLITLLVTAVALTLGLSVSKKVVTETKIDVDEENLRRAFDTAESGINYYLESGETEYQAPDGSVATISASEINKVSNIMEFAESTLPGGRANYWLVGHDTAGNVDYTDPKNFPADGNSNFNVCVGAGSSGLVTVEYFYGDDSLPMEFKVNRYFINLGGAVVNGFSPAVGGDCSGGRTIVQTIVPAAGTKPVLVSVRPLTFTLKAALATNSNLPDQGQELKSTAIFGDQNTGVRRTLKVYDLYNVPGFLFDAINGSNISSE